MKYLFLILMLLGTNSSNAQIFHFDSDSATIIKNTDQSPAHWYLEIFNDAGVDTTLRWKTHFSSVPTQWVVNFDDQNMFYNPVSDGDSADFTLYSGLSFPQKLIIGIAFNDVPGTASVHFDIYDPQTPQDYVTITYHYIVELASLKETYLPGGITLKGDQIYFEEQLWGGTFQEIAMDGTVQSERKIKDVLSLSQSNGSMIYRIIHNSEIYVIHEIRIAD